MEIPDDEFRERMTEYYNYLRVSQKKYRDLAKHEEHRGREQSAHENDIRAFIYRSCANKFADMFYELKLESDFTV